MKNKILSDKLFPVLEEKLHITYSKALSGGEWVYRKQQDNGLVWNPEDESCCIAKISTIDMDRDNEILMPEGMDSNEFMTNAICMLNHNYSTLPIGKIIKLESTPDTVYAKIQFASTPRAQEVFTLVKEKVLNACSIGYLTLKAYEAGTREFNQYVKDRFNGIIDKAVKRIIVSWKLLENSIVNIPANQNALVLAVSSKDFKISEKLMNELNIKGGTNSGHYGHTGAEGGGSISKEDMTVFSYHINDLGVISYLYEHAARLHDPSKYTSLARVNNKLGDGISVIFGFWKDNAGHSHSEIQAIRFDSTKFTVEQAQEWLKKHPEFKPISFIPASNGNKSETKIENKVEEIKPEIKIETKPEIKVEQMIIPILPKEPERYMCLVQAPLEGVVKELVDIRTKKYYGKIY